MIVYAALNFPEFMPTVQKLQGVKMSRRATNNTNKAGPVLEYKLTFAQIQAIILILILI